MDACFVTSKSFPATVEKLFPLLGSRISYSTRRRLFVSQFHQLKKVGTPLSVTCCQASSSLPSPSPQDEERPFAETDWRSFRARLVAGEKSSRSEEPSSVVNPDTVDDLPPPPAVTIGNKWAHTIHEPEKGCLLIATEKLDGVHIFERTVVLLLSMGPIGPTGLILNRPSLMSIKEMRSSVLDMSGTFANRPLPGGAEGRGDGKGVLAQPVRWWRDASTTFGDAVEGLTSSAPMMGGEGRRGGQGHGGDAMSGPGSAHVKRARECHGSRGNSPASAPHGHEGDASRPAAGFQRFKRNGSRKQASKHASNRITQGNSRPGHSNASGGSGSESVVAQPDSPRPKKNVQTGDSGEVCKKARSAAGILLSLSAQ